ncbi:MAG: serine hydrolase, partial [Thermomicrobiales bacterium]
GITSMAIGGTTLAERMPDEVRYYGPAGQATRASVSPNDGFVPVGYGSYYLRAMDAHGGYIATCDDLVRFMLAIDGTRGTALLTPETVTAMESTPRPESIGAGAGNADTKNGLAWDTLDTPDGKQWLHAGALEGSSACWTFRAPGGIAIAWIINTMPLEYVALFDGLKAEMIAALPTIKTWPEHDLFA